MKYSKRSPCPVIKTPQHTVGVVLGQAFLQFQLSLGE